MGAAPQGPPPAIQVDPSQHPDNQQAQGSGDPQQQIKDAIDQIRAAVSADGLSENERLLLEKITTLGQQLLATREKEQQAAMGASPAMNFLRRTSGGGQAA